MSIPWSKSTAGPVKTTSIWSIPVSFSTTISDLLDIWVRASEAFVWRQQLLIKLSNSMVDQEKEEAKERYAQGSAWIAYFWETLRAPGSMCLWWDLKEHLSFLPPTRPRVNLSVFQFYRSYWAFFCSDAGAPGPATVWDGTRRHFLHTKLKHH